MLQIAPQGRSLGRRRQCFRPSVGPTPPLAVSPPRIGLPQPQRNWPENISTESVPRRVCDFVPLWDRD